MNHEYQYFIGKLQEALAVDDRVNALDIKITIAHGRVHLTGEVPTEERRAAVQRIAQEMLPDLEVRNDITVLELAHAAKPEAVDD
jgi:osmotically-inducible protein OsmY